MHPRRADDGRLRGAPDLLAVGALGELLATVVGRRRPRGPVTRSPGHAIRFTHATTKSRNTATLRGTCRALG
ncbi:uncharacterized protein SOCE26_067220 [Sorangium cellulosum]|uniref:Uncharacterized protein n=1 Tax=Sorangium cellulosum TaxID=56 RepID=A0A2L0F161_SORCE|nr:uncharacterized protein SOCE26_067220 [Sorangium cellulosum]